jgi:hypothetical protein
MTSPHTEPSITETRNDAEVSDAQFDDLVTAEAVAGRFAASWKPDADEHGNPVWFPPKMCGAARRDGEPVPMDRDEAEWLADRGWAFAINQPANQVKAALELRGWRPDRSGKNRTWRWVDANNKVVPYAKPLTPTHVQIIAGGRDLDDDQLEAFIRAHRPGHGDAYDRAGVPWLRTMLGRPDLDPRIDPIPWPPPQTQEGS